MEGLVLAGYKFTWKIPNYSQKKLENGPGNFIIFLVDCEGGDFKIILKFYPHGYFQPGETEVTNREEWASLFVKAEGCKMYINSRHVEFFILYVL
jgi:hypothetical protein